MAHDRAPHVERHGGGPGTEHHPHPGRLGLRLGDLLVTAGTGACRGGQPVREQPAVRGVLQFERAAQQVAGQGGGDPVVRVVHGLSLSAGGRDDAARPGRVSGAGPVYAFGRPIAR